MKAQKIEEISVFDPIEKRYREVFIYRTEDGDVFGVEPDQIRAGRVVITPFGPVDI